MSVSVWNEKWLGFLATVWGIALVLPGDLFRGIPMYVIAAQYAPDTVWGIVMGVSGILLFFPVPVPVHKHVHWILSSVWLGLGILCISARFSPVVVMLATQCLVISMLHAGKFWRFTRPVTVRL